MHYARFWKGIRPCRSLTFSPWRWFAYACWWLHFNLVQLPPAPPRWLYRFAGRLTPGFFSQVRWAGADTEWRVRRGARPENWIPAGTDMLHLIFLACRGWTARRCETLKGWRGPAHEHRCDFTDRHGGILYGGPGGAMNELFDQFVANISPSAEQGKAVAAALSEFQILAAGGGNGEVN